MAQITFITTNLQTAINRYKRTVKYLTLAGEGETSEMYNVIKRKPREHSKVHVILLLRDEKVIGWIWAFHNETAKTRHHDIWVYVKRKYRRYGYGKILYDKMYDFLKRFKRSKRIYPWDDRSKDFFKSIGALGDE